MPLPDLTLPLRRAIVTRLKDDGGVTARVPESQVYGMRQPSQTAWPFTRYGSPDTVAAGHGSGVSVTLHGFSKATFEDECCEIMKALKAALDGAVLTLVDGGDSYRAHVHWRNTQIIPDAAEANAWHGIARFDATIEGCA